jgi:hypothetical protein
MKRIIATLAHSESDFLLAWLNRSEKIPNKLVGFLKVSASNRDYGSS